MVDIRRWTVDSRRSMVDRRWWKVGGRHSKVDGAVFSLFASLLDDLCWMIFSMVAVAGTMAPMKWKRARVISCFF